MNTKNDMANRIVELADNVMLGLEHVCKQLQNGEGDHTYNLMVDILEGYMSMENALSLVMETGDPQMESLSKSLRASFSEIVQYYEKKDELGALNELSNRVLPSYRNWLEYVNNHLKIDIV